MQEIDWSHWLLTIAAGLSAVATGLAALAAWLGPQKAAEISEKQRVENDRNVERRRLKFFVFTTVMQYRDYIFHEESARALNFIDIVFSEERSVRDAWADLYNAFGDNSIPEHERNRRIRELLRAIAEDLGLSNSLRTDDFGRVYFPNSLAEEHHLRSLERQAGLKRFLESRSAGGEGASSSPFPPRPE